MLTLKQAQQPVLTTRGNGPASADAQSSGPCPDLSLATAVRRHARRVLELNHGNKLHAARQLGISRSTLYRILGNSAPLP